MIMVFTLFPDKSQTDKLNVSLFYLSHGSCWLNCKDSETTGVQFILFKNKLDCFCSFVLIQFHFVITKTFHKSHDNFLHSKQESHFSSSIYGKDVRIKSGLKTKLFVVPCVVFVIGNEKFEVLLK